VVLDEPAVEEDPFSHCSLPAQPPDRHSTPTTLEATHLKNLHIGLVSIQGCPGFLAGARHAREATEDLPVLDIPLGALRRIIAFLSVGSTIVSGTGIKPTYRGWSPFSQIFARMMRAKRLIL
jgi:hypothetical protein